MTHNDVLRSLRYLMDVSDATMAAIIRLAGGEVGPGEIAAFLKKEDEEGYVPCGDRVMAQFLNGLILYRRGVDPDRPPLPLITPVTNNEVLKKVRVAFSLKDDELIALLAKSGFQLSKAELGALCRRPDHRNFRVCGDQLLRNLLKAMSS